MYSKEHVYYNEVTKERRNHNGTGIVTTGMNATQIATAKKNNAKDLNIDDRITKFQNLL